jgi:hypothetical protein
MGGVRKSFSVARALQLIALTLLLSLWGAAPSSAQNAGELLRLLHDSQSFRVRARAALALANVSGDPRTAVALEAALLDGHAAVRAAAATALGLIGSRRSLPALRRAAGDGDNWVVEQVKVALRQIAARDSIARAVPAQDVRPATLRTNTALASVRYAVVVGEMRNRSGLADAALPRFLGERIAEELRALGSFAVFADAEMTETVAAELERNRLPLFRVEGNITRIDPSAVGDEHQVHCEVSLLLMDEPARNLRGLIKGSATSGELRRSGSAAQREQLARRALRNAVRSAMANAAQATEAAARERTPEAHAEAAPNERSRRGRRRR